MAINNMFSTGFNSGIGTGFSGGGWSNQINKSSTKAPTKQEKFPGLNNQQIANIEKVTADLTGAEKNQEQQKLYQAMIQYIEEQNFNDNRMAANNERFRNSLTKSDPRECNFDQSACRQSTLVDLVKSARNLKANTPEETVMSMFMQEMDYKGISMDKLNNYLDKGDETILYEAGLKTNLGGTKDLINQAGITEDKSWGEKNLREKGETVTNYTNLLGWGTEELDNAASKFADKWLDRGNTIVEKTTDNLKDKINNMSKEEIEKYRKQYKKELKDKKWTVGQVEGDNLLKQWVNIIKGNISYDYNDEDFFKWLISKKANLGETLTSADDKLIEGDSAGSIVQMYGNIPSSALKTFTATVRGMTNPYDTLKGLYKIIATEEGHQAILDRYGSWDGFSRALNEDPVGVADDILAVAELGTNLARGGLKLTGKVTGNQSLLNTANKVPVVGSANDALASKTLGGTYKAMDYVGDYTDSNLVKGVNRVLQTESNLGKMTEEGVKLYESIKNSNFVDELINKMVGIEKEDRTFIKNNKDLVNDYISGKKNVETVYDEVKEKISDKALENSEMGKQYDAIREKGQTVNTDALASDMVDKFKKYKITINADGNLEFEKLSKFNPTQQKALQEAWQVIKDAQAAGTVDAGTILDLRQKFDDLVNRTGKPTELRNTSSVDKTTEQLIKGMRETIDARAKTQIDGLAELDAKYSSALDDMRQIKKDWFDSDGKIRDNARSKIRNMTKAGNEERLARLEKLIPGITQDLKALDAALTVEKLTKNSVGQYYKGGGIALGLQALFNGNILSALGYTTAGILATPKNFVKVIEREPEIASRLMNGDTITSADISRLQAIASRLEDGMEE